jgi:hypothetical protein
MGFGYAMRYNGLLGALLQINFMYVNFMYDAVH